MADRMNTGNSLLDAWINAFDALIPAHTPTAASPDAHAGAANGSASSPWERMFLGNFPGPSALGSSSVFGSASNAMKLWGDLAQRSIGVMTALGASSKAGDPLGEALEKSFGVAGDVGGGAAEMPALLTELAKVSAVLYAARETYQAVMLATWQRAFEEVTREAMRRSSDGKPVVTPAQWLALSNVVADRVFVEAFNSQAYLDAQHQLSSALADQRHAETKLVEIFARFGHFPTRRALDEIAAEVSELRRRVRRLERASRDAAPKPRRKARAVDER